MASMRWRSELSQLVVSSSYAASASGPDLSSPPARRWPVVDDGDLLGGQHARGHQTEIARTWPRSAGLRFQHHRGGKLLVNAGEHLVPGMTRCGARLDALDGLHRAGCSPSRARW